MRSELYWLLGLAFLMLCGYFAGGEGPAFTALIVAMLCLVRGLPK